MIKKLRVTVDGKSYDVTVELPDEPGAGGLAPAPVSVPISAPPPPPVSVPAAPAASGSSGGGSGPGDVRSPLSGRIIAINVQPGQEVKEGDHILTVEAMKMNTSVVAPKSGKITEISTTVGSAVDEGQVLARIG